MKTKRSWFSNCRIFPGIGLNLRILSKGGQLLTASQPPPPHASPAKFLNVQAKKKNETRGENSQLTKYTKGIKYPKLNIPSASAHTTKPLFFHTAKSMTFFSPLYILLFTGGAL